MFHTFLLKVVFSDEKKFNLDGPDGFNAYWRDLRKEPNFFSRRNFGGGSLMIWGAFCSDGKLPLAFPSTKMNSAEYQQVLQNNLIPFMHQFRQKNYVFQHDNASVHASKSTTEWLLKKNIQTLCWPACSPDCNPIENLWGILVRRVYANNKKYNSVSDLKNSIVMEWNAIDDQILNNLSGSMPDRIFQLISNKGRRINY